MDQHESRDIVVGLCTASGSGSGSGSGRGVRRGEEEEELGMVVLCSVVLGPAARRMGVTDRQWTRRVRKNNCV